MCAWVCVWAYPAVHLTCLRKGGLGRLQDALVSDAREAYGAGQGLDFRSEERRQRKRRGGFGGLSSGATRRQGHLRSLQLRGEKINTKEFRPRRVAVPH